MRLAPALLALTLTAAAIAGCVDDDVPDGPVSSYNEATQRYEQQIGAALDISWAPGAVSRIVNTADHEVGLLLPFGWIEIEGTPGSFGGFILHDDAITLNRGEARYFLAPPREGPASFTLTDDLTEIFTLAPEEGAAPEDELISGENVWELSAYQEEHFPHREPCRPDGTYGESIEYFAQYFEDLGMTVEVDPYGTQDASDTTGCQTALGPTGPESVANVVATLPGTDPDAPTIFVAGGHFDMVPGTTHAAFDDTSGTVSTLELARVMSQFEWKHTLMFAAWGGEENGLLGSQFWVQTHPEARASITSYFNLDVVGMSWPVPIPKPDPIVISAGPDAPSDDQGGGGGSAEEMLRFMQELQEDWFGFPSEVDGEKMFIYEGTASGQAGGYAEVNAQSDHTPFHAAGIPAFFIFNGDALASDNPVELHTERDTLENMTRYAYFAGEETLRIMTEEVDKGESYVWNPSEYDAAKQALADSWETTLWFPFYTTVLQDTGYWYAPGTAGQAEAAEDTEPPSGT